LFYSFKSLFPAQDTEKARKNEDKTVLTR